MRSYIILAFTIISFSLPEFSQDNSLIPKNPVPISSFISEDQQILSMPLAERINRKIVPQRGLCSTIPGADEEILFSLKESKEKRIFFSNSVPRYYIDRSVVYCK
jgi:hypothetical protein